MAGERTQQETTTESTEERTVSSNGLTFDERVEEVRELRQAVDELSGGSSILFDETSPTGTSSRRGRAAQGEDYARRMGAGFATERKTPTTSLGSTQGLSSTSDPFGPSRRDLAQRLDRLEGKVDALLAALDLDGDRNE